MLFRLRIFLSEHHPARLVFYDGGRARGKRMEARATAGDAKKRTENDVEVEEAAEEYRLPDRGDGAKGVLPRVLKNIISKRRGERTPKKRRKISKSAGVRDPPDGAEADGELHVRTAGFPILVFMPNARGS